jgi:hypothetical protein
VSVTSPGILDRLQGVQRAGEGWLAFCPAHEDREQRSLSISQTSERTLLHCFVGCTAEQIVHAVGTTLAALFTANAPPAAAGSAISAGDRVPLTLEAFADAKGLPASFLQEHGVVEDSRGLRITYRLADGSEARRQRRRTALAAKDGSTWDGPRGESPVAYGLWRLDEASDLGELWLVEGETDTLTGWLHNLPVLGIPGADMTKVLAAEALRGLVRVWIIQEPGRGGSTFVARCAKRLAELGFEGEAHVVRLPTKDLNDLHRLDAHGFADALARAQAEAMPLHAVTVPAEDPGADSTPERSAPSSAPASWTLYDGAEAWGFPPPQPCIDGLLMLEGVTWVGGRPKSFKSLLVLYLCLCIAARRTAAADHFTVRATPRILYVGREDGGARFELRRDEILEAWACRPELRAIRFLIREHVDLLDPEHLLAP